MHDLWPGMGYNAKQCYGRNGVHSLQKKAAGKKRRRAVLQYEKDGTFVREYDSALEAAQILHLSCPASIHSACQRSKKSAYGFIWKYADDDYPLSELIEANVGIRHSKTSSNCPKRVAQVKDGEVIAIYESANAAGRAMGAVNGGNITACCKGKYKMAYGYEWRYAD